ncbi:dihydrofolate reductase family protein [Cytobacillus horneckiae]|uniref:dihydrofolate reductase family protein n=1 Tax=Cytobacillus horneckiae TaxID=549687 RepID=UPI00203F8A9B|nr:dihydrofolate reductase family protein [Cytobacillus horneckiae]MCM3176840.1 dihydrofolate reductase family protein [Cytobacillus horneckiae]
MRESRHLFNDGYLDGYIEADSVDIGWSIPDAELRQHFNAGKNMILGGAEIAAAFMDLNLIDEYRIYVHPWERKGNVSKR